MVNIVKKKTRLLIKDKKIKHRSKNRLNYIVSRIATSYFTPAAIWLVVGLFIVFFKVQFPYSITKEEEVKFDSSYSLIKNDSLELGDSRIDTKGLNGLAEIEYRYTGTLFDFFFRKEDIKVKKISSNIIKNPVNEVIVEGSKKYQYMHCSDGSYRYYTDEQFKNVYTGFTHKSIDYCAENNQGAMSHLSNSPNTTKAESVELDRIAEMAKIKAAMSAPTATLGDKPKIDAPVYTGPVDTGNPEYRKLCDYNYSTALARLGSPPSGWDYGDSSVVDYYNNLDIIKATYESCLIAAGY